MRRFSVFSWLPLISLGGCVLMSTYDYGDYEDAPGDTSSSSSSSSGSTGGMGGSSSSTSGMGGGGAGGAGGSGGLGGGGSGGVAGMGGGPICTVELCNNGLDDDCKNDGDCSVIAALNLRVGDNNHQAIKATSAPGNGEVAIAGDFTGTLAFNGKTIMNGTANLYPFVASLDAAGTALAAHSFTAKGMATAVAAQGTDLFAGLVLLDSLDPPTKTILFRKFDSQGAGWSHSIGSDKDNGAPSVASGADGTIFAAGSFTGSVSPPLGCPEVAPFMTSTVDSLLMQLNASDGACPWAVRIEQSRTASVAATANTVVIGGSYTGNIGLTGAVPAKGTAAFIVGYDVKMHTMSGKNFLATQTSGVVSFLGVAIGEDGSWYATGTLKGSILFPGGDMVISGGGGVDFDMIVAKYDAAGKLQWLQRFGGPGLQTPQSIAVENGNVFVSGTTAAQMAIAPNTDSGPLCATGKCMFLLKLKADTGEPAWGRAFGAAEMANDATALIATDGSNLWLGGGWSTDIDFGGASLPTKGAQDVVLAKFAPVP